MHNTSPVTFYCQTTSAYHAYSTAPHARSNILAMLVVSSVHTTTFLQGLEMAWRLSKAGAAETKLYLRWSPDGPHPTASAHHYCPDITQEAYFEVTQMSWLHSFGKLRSSQKDNEKKPTRCLNKPQKTHTRKTQSRPPLKCPKDHAAVTCDRRIGVGRFSLTRNHHPVVHP